MPSGPVYGTPLRRSTCYFGFDNCFICPDPREESEVEQEIFVAPPWPPTSTSDEAKTDCDPKAETKTPSTPPGRSSRASRAGVTPVSGTALKRNSEASPSLPPPKRVEVAPDPTSQPSRVWEIIMKYLAGTPDDFRAKCYIDVSNQVYGSIGGNLTWSVPDSVTMNPASVFEWGPTSKDGNVPFLRNRLTGCGGYLMSDNGTNFNDRVREIAVKVTTSRPDLPLDKGGVISLTHNVNQTFHPFIIRNERLMTMVATLLDRAYASHLAGGSELGLFFLRRPRISVTSELSTLQVFPDLPS